MKVKIKREKKDSLNHQPGMISGSPLAFQLAERSGFRCRTRFLHARLSYVVWKGAWSGLKDTRSAVSDSK